MVIFSNNLLETDQCRTQPLYPALGIIVALNLYTWEIGVYFHVVLALLTGGRLARTQHLLQGYLHPLSWFTSCLNGFQSDCAQASATATRECGFSQQSVSRCQWPEGTTVDPSTRVQRTLTGSCLINGTLNLEIGHGEREMISRC